MAEITYTQVGDYLLPNLVITNEPQPNYGKYGMLRKRYLKEHRSSVYYSLLMSGKLNQHLSEVDMLVHDTVSRLVIALAKKQGIDETVKASHQMVWVGAINMIKAQVEEIALSEYVFY